MTNSNEVTVDKRRVRGVVEVGAKSVSAAIPSLHPLEALIGFSELAARVMAEVSSNDVAQKEMLKMAITHMETTLKTAKQKR